MIKHPGVSRMAPFENIVSHYQPLNPQFGFGKYGLRQD